MSAMVTCRNDVKQTPIPVTSEKLCFLWFRRKGQSSGDYLNALGLSCRVPPERSNMDVLYAAPVAPLELVFVSGLLDYSCIPQDMILNSLILKLGGSDV